MISFESYLINDRTISKHNVPYKQFTLKAIEETTIRVIPQQFRSDVDLSMFSASASDDSWNKINIPVADHNLNYKVDFNGIQFEAKLTNIIAAIKENKDGTYNTIYAFTFIKELDTKTQVDTQISSMINVREADANGKMQIVKYATTLEKI